VQLRPDDNDNDVLTPTPTPTPSPPTPPSLAGSDETALASGEPSGDTVRSNGGRGDVPSVPAAPAVVPLPSNELALSSIEETVSSESIDPVWLSSSDSASESLDVNLSACAREGSGRVTRELVRTKYNARLVQRDG
jgi:hypothetical protein